MKVKMGDILVAQEDVEYSNDKASTTIYKGDKSIVGFDKRIHVLKERTIIIPDDEFKIEGYSADGLSEFISAWLDKNFDLDKILKKSEYTKDDICECIKEALTEIGMTREENTEENEEKE